MNMAYSSFYIDDRCLPQLDANDDGAEYDDNLVNDDDALVA